MIVYTINIIFPSSVSHCEQNVSHPWRTKFDLSKYYIAYLGYTDPQQIEF